MTMAPSHLPNLKSIAALMKYSAYLGSEAELRIDIAKIFCIFASDKPAAIRAAPTYSTAYLLVWRERQVGCLNLRELRGTSGKKSMTKRYFHPL